MLDCWQCIRRRATSLHILLLLPVNLGRITDVLSQKIEALGVPTASGAIFQWPFSEVMWVTWSLGTFLQISTHVSQKMILKRLLNFKLSVHFHHQPQAVERQFVLELSSHKEAHVKLFYMGLDGADVVGFCYRLWTCFSLNGSNHNGAVSMHFELPTLIGINQRKGDTVMDEAIKYAKPNMQIFAKWHAHLKYVSTYIAHMARFVGSSGLFSARVIPRFTLQSRRMWRRDLNVFVRCIAEMLPQTPMWYHMCNKQLA